MAKGASITFDAKTGKARGEIAKVTKELQRTKGETKALAREVGALTRKQEASGRKGKDAGLMASSGIKSLATSLLAVVGPGALLAQVNQAYQTWIRNIREVAQEAEKASAQMIAFAALQAGGEKAARVERAMALMTRYGVADRGEGFITIQGLQSAIGQARPELSEAEAWEAGMAAAEPVFAAGQLDIPIKRGRELEVLGAAQGQAPGMAVRRAYIAGQLSGRDPRALAGGAIGLKFWQDKEMGFAAAAVLAGAGKEEALATYLRQAGIGLSGVSPLAAKGGLFEQLGVAGGTQYARLAAMAATGLRTPEQLAAAGLTEQRQQEAISDLLRNFPALAPLALAIREGAVPGVFARQRAAVEAELPTTALEREIAILRSAAKDEQAIGPAAEKALEVERRQRIRGLAFRRMGFEQAAGFDLIDEEGRATVADELQYRFHGGTIGALRKVMEEIRDDLRGQAKLGPELTPADSKIGNAGESYGE